jgi:type II secretory pathway pseudopilin PulG
VGSSSAEHKSSLMTATTTRQWHSPNEPRTCYGAGRRGSVKGFSLLELMIVMAIGFTVAAISVMTLMPMFAQNHLDQAYDTTISVLRSYRNKAVTQGNRYIITFWTTDPPCQVANQSCIQVQVWGCNNCASVGTNMAPTTVFTYELPQDIQFATQAGFPASTPDSFSNATTAIWTTHACNVTEGGDACLVFSPDGSAQDDTGGDSGGSYVPGNFNNALIYLTRPGSSMYSSRAIDVWGASGRVRGWRLYNEGGTNYWVQQ